MDPKQPVTLATALGCLIVSVVYRDGTQEAVPVYALPVREIGQWAALDSAGTIESEVQLVERHCCRKPEGWADTLSPESYDAVLAKGEELNRPIYARVRSRADQRAREWAGVAESQNKLVMELGARISGTPSPASAAPAISVLPTP